jgi:hypothetical protein
MFHDFTLVDPDADRKNYDGNGCPEQAPAELLKVI